jgi:hypothetical protein
LGDSGWLSWQLFYSKLSGTSAPGRAKDHSFAGFIRMPRGVNRVLPTALLLKSPQVGHQTFDFVV